jgi:hypothetical protein
MTMMVALVPELLALDSITIRMDTFLVALEEGDRFRMLLQALAHHHLLRVCVIEVAVRRQLLRPTSTTATMRRTRCKSCHRDLPPLQPTLLSRLRLPRTLILLHLIRTMLTQRHTQPTLLLSTSRLRWRNCTAWDSAIVEPTSWRCEPPKGMSF